MSSPKKDPFRRTQLQMQFHSTRREDFQTVETYVEKLEWIANSLAELDSQISDSEMVSQLLAGLPDQYKPLQKKITSRRPLPNFDEACSMLYMQEDILLQEQSTSDPDVGDPKKSSAFFTKDKLYTLGTVAAVVGTVATVYAVAGPVGTVIGTVRASRMIAVGTAAAVAGITAMAGWNFGKQSVATNSSS